MITDKVKLNKEFKNISYLCLEGGRGEAGGGGGGGGGCALNRQPSNLSVVRICMVYAQQLWSKTIRSMRILANRHRCSTLGHIS